MRMNRHALLMKYGVVALAGIAVLGWVREPEKHLSSNDSTIASSEQARAIFPPPPDTAGMQSSSILPGDPIVIGNEAEFAPAVKEGIANRPVDPGLMKTREHAPV